MKSFNIVVIAISTYVLTGCATALAVTDAGVGIAVGTVSTTVGIVGSGVKTIVKHL